ncbi:MAG TPA: sigma-70 family RNA polymerase sigma factor [Longimicrobium sp.]
MQQTHTATPASGAPSSRLSAGDDAELLRRMAAGDEAALGALYDRWSPLVHSVVMRVVNDADDAEELVEETFWQAWRQAGRYDASRGAISGWLVVMARSRALDRVRLRGWQRAGAAASMDGDGVPEPVIDVGGPLDAAELDETRRLVRAALERLPAEQRETVEMAYFRGMSQTEIAAATGQPLGTVKTRARLALQKLREALAVLREEPA